MGFIRYFKNYYSQICIRFFIILMVFTFLMYLPLFISTQFYGFCSQAMADSVPIKIFNQSGYTSGNNTKWRLTRIDSNKNRDLASAGCGLFAYAHAIQWLTETTRGDDILTELIAVCSDPNGNAGHKECSHGSKDNKVFLAYREYVKTKYGLYDTLWKVSDKTDASIKTLFNDGGVLVFMIHWNGGGHVLLASDYTVINGVTYIQIIDSHSQSSTKSGRPFYNFTYKIEGTTVTKIDPLSGGKSYWIPIAKFKEKANSPCRINGGTWRHNNNMTPPELLQISTEIASLDLTKTLNLSVTAYPAGTSNRVTWTTSDESVATVSNGVVTPHIAGKTVTITATSIVNASVKASCQVTTYYQDSDSTKSLIFNGIKYPHQYVKGSNYTWSGSVESDVDLKSVTVNFYADKAYTYEAQISLGTKKFSMSSVGSALLKELPLGNFTFSISATDVCNRRIGFSNSSSTVVSSGSNTSWDCKNTFQRPMLLGSGERNGHRYEVYQSTSKDWEYDRDYAYEKGGHLIFIEDEGENTYISDLGKNVGAAWIYTGGYYDGSSWVWLDGTPVTYFAWRTANIPVATYLYPTVIGLGTEDNRWGRPPKNEFSYFVIEYEPIKVSDIVISAEQEVVVGDSITINVEAYPENAYNSEIELISSNPDIAIVDSQNHRITGISEGWVTITAKATDEGGAEKSFDLWVQHAMIHPIDIKVNADSSLYTDENTIEINIGDSVELQTEFIPSNTDDQSVTYISSNEEIAYIEDYSSIVIPVSAGECEITARSNDGGLSSSITVIVLPVSGECGNNLTWSKTGTELMISGTGAMYDYDNNGGPWGQGISSVKLEEGITSIGAYAFYYSQVNTIEWPNTLKTIGRLAFHGCKQLETLNNLPEGLETLGTDAFSGCTNLRSVILPSSLKTIGGDAFQFTSLETISIPSSVRTIGHNPFCCTTIKSIQVQNSDYFKSLDGVLYTKDGKILVAYPCEDERSSYIVEEGTETIQNNAFYGQRHLTNLVFPWGLKKIGVYACYGINTLQSVNIPGTVTEIGNNALVSCSNLTIRCVEGSAAYEYAVANSIPFTLIDFNPDFVLPVGMSVIEEEAFMGISAKSIKLPEGITEIRANAFANCPNLKQIYIPEGCERIATTAFSGVSDLVIYGITESYAEFYAERRGFEFEDVK